MTDSVRAPSFFLEEERSAGWEAFNEASSWRLQTHAANIPSAQEGERDRLALLGEKTYSRFERLRPAPVQETRLPPEAIRTRRPSARAFDSSLALEVAEWWGVLNALMSYAPEDASGMPYGSAGAIYGVQAYCACLQVTGMNGLFHLRKAHHELERLLPIDYDALARALPGQGWALDAQALVILTASMSLYERRYGERGYRFALIEAGQMAQQIVLAASAFGLGCCILGGFVDAEVRTLLRLRPPDREIPVCLVAFGSRS